MSYGTVTSSISIGRILSLGQQEVLHTFFNVATFTKKCFCFRHLKSHVHEEYIDVDKLSEPQMIMQHFRNYDLDKNGNIDGLEILKAAHKMNGNYLKQYSSENRMPEIQIYSKSRPFSVWYSNGQTN